MYLYTRMFVLDYGNYSDARYDVDVEVSSYDYQIRRTAVTLCNVSSRKLYNYSISVILRLSQLSKCKHYLDTLCTINKQYDRVVFILILFYTVGRCNTYACGLTYTYQIYKTLLQP